MKNMFKFSAVLSAYTVVACVGLAFVYTATAPLIEASAAKAVNEALVEIFPEAGDFEDVTGTIDSGDEKILFTKAYLAKNVDSVLGMIIQVSGPTYGKATILVGVDTRRTLKPIKFMELTDTPGLGAKASTDPFKNQFTGKSLDDPFKAGTAGSSSDIAAISGATITSKAVAKIVSLTGLKAGAYLADKYPVQEQE